MEVWTFRSSANDKASEQKWHNVKINVLETGKNWTKFQRSLLAKSSRWKSKDFGDARTCKGKAVPLQAWSGPEGSRKSRFYVFMTTAQDGGKVVSLTHRPPLPPGNRPGTHLC